MKVLVIGGGISDEREISVRSSKAIFDAAQSSHQVELYDWDGTGDWLDENAARFDVILPILHGQGGEDGGIQLILEGLGVSYLGSDAVASKLCFNKLSTLKLLRQNGITTPQGKLVSRDEYLNDSLAQQSHVLKPFNGGSSVDTFIYPSVPTIDYQALDLAFERHPTMFLEEFISGVEISVPILDGKELDVVELIPPQGGVFDYENKYNGKSQELIPALSLTEDMQVKAKQLGRDVHSITGCRHISRVDMIVVDDKLYVLEINTMPGMTDQSIFPKVAAAAGMDLPNFVDYLISLAHGGLDV